MDTSTPKNVDCLILTSLTQMPTLFPGSYRYYDLVYQWFFDSIFPLIISVA